MASIWYKEQRTKEERREIYQRLRKMGYPAEIARRLRDWSENHIELFIKSNPPEQIKAAMGKAKEEREFYEAYPELEFQVSGIDYTGMMG
ncbi:hypothetical protein [Thermococcus sp. JdF3]|uniref:hypothetical protein n=1 Tax=Thermococcus sp. JdF3 TaxID=1638258 RepID=UPI001438FDEA|nr:hypothetical protein [Thermococcus sp. JdF3]NJE01851.1 hypothetical protein [Thermococcus sp. JdF3]